MLQITLGDAHARDADPAEGLPPMYGMAAGDNPAIVAMNNRGCWKVNPQRARQEEDVVFVYHGTIVAAAHIHGLRTCPTHVDRVIFRLSAAEPDDTIYDLIGQESLATTGTRQPVQYVPAEQVWARGVLVRKVGLARLAGV